MSTEKKEEEFTQEEVRDWLVNPITLKIKNLLEEECKSLLESLIHNIQNHNECLKIAGEYQAYLDILQSMEALRK